GATTRRHRRRQHRQHHQDSAHCAHLPPPLSLRVWASLPLTRKRAPRPDLRPRPRFDALPPAPYISPNVVHATRDLASAGLPAAGATGVTGAVTQEHILMSKYVYFFGGSAADGSGKMKELLGGKGANLAEMCLIGLPVPAGFTITTEVCTYYYDHGKTYPPELKAQV